MCVGEYGRCLRKNQNFGHRCHCKDRLKRKLDETTRSGAEGCGIGHFYT